MMSRSHVALAAGVVVMLCAPFAIGRPVHDAIDGAQSAVRGQLYAPGTANFRHVALSRQGDVCGEIDSRNAEGGRTGYARFVYDHRTGKALLSLHDPDFRQFFVMDDNEYTNGNAAVITDDACHFVQQWMSDCTPDQVRPERPAQRLCRLYTGGKKDRARLKKIVGAE